MAKKDTPAPEAAQPLDNPTPAPKEAAKPEAKQVPAFHREAGLPPDFDKELRKQGARDTTQKEHLLATVNELGEAMRAQVGKYLGRKVAAVEAYIEPGMKVGSMAEGFAVFFVDTVERGDLAIFPVAEGTEPSAGKAARYAAERGRLVIFPKAANYVLHATASRARAVLIFA